jgi:hypothetical protein
LAEYEGRDFLPVSGFGKTPQRFENGLVGLAASALLQALTLSDQRARFGCCPLREGAEQGCLANASLSGEEDDLPPAVARPLEP